MCRRMKTGPCCSLLGVGEIGSSTNESRETGSPHGEEEKELILHKVNTKWMKDMKTKSETLKLWKTEVKHFKMISISKNFLRSTPIA